MPRIAIWSAGVLLVVIVGVALAFRFSPWPSVAVINYLFAKSGQASDARLEKHVPEGIVAQRNIAYGDGTDEKLDIYYKSRARAAQPTIIWVHGGAWVAGSKEGVGNYLKVLAGHGYATVALEYSTGYGSTYPKPVEQVNAALGYLTRNAAALRMDPKHFILAGDSAGAQIMSQVAVIITNPRYAAQMKIVPTLKRDQVTAILLLSGAYDLNSFDFHGDYAWLLNPVFWAYSGSRDFLNDERFRLLFRMSTNSISTQLRARKP
jgi:acetyl esterase/lipase